VAQVQAAVAQNCTEGDILYCGEKNFDCVLAATSLNETCLCYRPSLDCLYIQDA